MSIKTVNSLSHGTDWTVGTCTRARSAGGHDHRRLHLLDAAALYGKKEMYSIRLIDWHFWTTTLVWSCTSHRCGLQESCRG